MKKRFLSLFLSVVMALSVFSVVPITASAEETQNTYTVAGKTTGYVSARVATGTAVSEVKTHSIVGTIAPDGWNPQGEANLMTLNGDTYELILTGVKADTYEFKMTTNGQWDPAYDFNGKIASGGSNECITVPEDNSTVKFTFKEKDGFVRAYINGIDYLSGFNTYETPYTTSKGGYYIPYEGTKTYRYYFEMPESWKTFANATACCYWWEGTDNCDKVCVVNPDNSEYKEG
ncbi:MAG: hypothetical protein SO152_03175, partial [Ruminococcus sp.]|nr:hypothetical protein [Ruminococcus sp.]